MATTGTTDDLAIAVEVHPTFTRLHPASPGRGRALVPFLQQSVGVGRDDPMLASHSLFWEVRELCRTLAELGFTVDAVDLGAPPPEMRSIYDALLTVHDGVPRYRGLLRPSGKAIQWLTGSHPEFQNQREQSRIRALDARRGCSYAPKRQIPNVAAELAGIAAADHCALIGNATTLASYPADWRGKFELFAVTTNFAPAAPETDAPPPRDFLWFSASGAVLKGLDLLLDLFAARDWPTLHVVGPVEQEEDFMNIYFEELNDHPRIRRHGFIPTTDPRLAAIFRRCAAIVHPSASEGMCGSVATGLSAGLFPIVSRECGIDLPDGTGFVLENCSHGEIEDAIEAVREMDARRLAAVSATLRALAAERFSRRAFSSRAREVLGRWLSA